MKKLIIVQWVKVTGDQFYDKEMRIIYSTHKKFIVGYRFDFGFFNIATKEGYSILSLPL